MQPNERPLPHPPVGPNQTPELPRTPTSPLEAPAGGHDDHAPRPPTGPVPAHPTKLRLVPRR